MRSTVLIADESITNRRMLSSILKTEYSVMEASSRTQALTILENNSDLITIALISDTLAFEGGKNLFEELMSNPDIANIPVVMTSSNVEKSVIEKAINFGVYDYIVRPYIQEIVLNRLRNIISLRVFALESSKKSMNNSKRQIEGIQNIEAESNGYIHFSAETFTIDEQTGFFKEISKSISSYKDFYKILKESLKETEDKLELLNKLAPESIKRIIATDFTELEQDITMIIDGKERNITLILKGFEQENSPVPKAALIVKDKTYELIQQRIYAILNKNENEIVGIIDHKNDFVRYRELSEETGEFLPEKYTTYDELIKYLFEKLRVDTVDKQVKYDLTIEYIIERLENSTEYDCVFYYESSKGRLFKRLRFQYFDDEKEKMLITVTDITSQFEMDALTCKLNYQGFVNAAKKTIVQYPYDLTLVTVVFKNYKEVSELAGKDTAEEFVNQIYKKLDNSKLTPVVMGRNNEYFYMLVKKYKIDGQIFKTLNTLKLQRKGKEFNSNLRFGLFDIYLGNTDVEDMINKTLIAEALIDTDPINVYKFYSNEIVDPNINQSTINYAIEKALTDDEIIPFYQPIIDIRTDQVAMAEALIRWKKNGDLLSPDRFMPVLENSGLISLTDRKMIELTGQMLTNNPKLLENIPITVNLSRIDFFDNDLVSSIMNMLNIHKNVYYEITESIDISMSNEINDTVKKIKKAGSKVLLDDFGSGYSTYKSLFESNFDLIKIDADLIKNITISTFAEATIRSIIEMAHAGGMKVIAEGVESKEQLRFLKDNDCDFIQGFYYSKSLPEKQFINFVEEYNRR